MPLIAYNKAAAPKQDDVHPSLRRLAAYKAANLECAHIIIADVPKYGGEEALVVIWARMILGRNEAAA